MYSTKLLRLLLSVLLTLFGSASASSQTDADIEKMLAQLDNGKVTGNVYENKLLGIRLRFPKTMAPDPTASVAALTKDGIAQFRDARGKADHRLIDEMIRKERIVFTLDLPERRDSLGAAMSLTIKKDETKGPLGPMVDRTIEFFTTDGKTKLVKTPSDARLGPLDMISFSVLQKIEGNDVLSKLYTGRRNGYLLTFSISYSDEAGLTEMDSVLRAIEDAKIP